ncbi:MAG TPA: damage-inducible protein, partial [Cyanothece sp. UBA12306]|nr:damage-inducible protein [Cyanothece sp. UBA12306]
YKVVWQVLQALRAHDDRFNITINQIELNQQRPKNINILGVGGGKDDKGNSNNSPTVKAIQTELNFPGLEEWRDAIYAQIVVKCGDRRYWEDWAKDVAVIADHHISRIKGILEGNNPKYKAAFANFLAGLHSNLNPSISEDDAIEMLSQHLITKPVFDALFEDYEFTKLNPVSIAMQTMLTALEDQSLTKETESLHKFYDSVRERAKGIDNAVGKQKIVIELYDKFFKTAFPQTADRLGIVYTPIEVVDFIIKSVDVALKQEFNLGLTDEGVHILDPFTGTGSFIVRLLQSGLIKPEDLTRKFTQEIHANEIILLAYYIAAINIESTFHDLKVSLTKEASKTVSLTQESPQKVTLSKESLGDETGYKPFNGIVLTDTFQMFENDGTLKEKMFPENNQRVVSQKEQEIKVIIGNPPYSAGQKSENDSNKNLKYEQLDSRIEETYANYSTATNKNSLYDSYIRSIRWASDRIGDKGIIGFVTNGSFIDGNSSDGLRKCFIDEFTSIYCFNLRGNARTAGEDRRKEKGNVFGEGTRTPVAITLLIKNPNKTENCQLFYHDIGDYLKREKKLEIIKEFSSISGIKWETITPNDSHDWINQRDPAFDNFISLGDKKDKTTQTIFDVYSSGVKTNRDPWCYHFSYESISKNMTKMIDFYNSQVEEFKNNLKGQTISNPDERKKKVEAFIDTDPKKISWSRGLKNDLGRCVNYTFYSESVVKGMYRPFCKQWAYFNKHFNDMIYQMPKIFPNESIENLVICVTGIGASKDFSALMVNCIPNLHFHDTSQCFPLYSYEKQESEGYKPLLPGFETDNEYVKKENIPNTILNLFRSQYNHKSLTKEDIFYYIYGILHSPEYKQRFAADLKKMLPRIPFAKDFWLFSKAGRDLAYWHLNYEIIEPYPLKEYQELLYLSPEDYRVEKMIFGKRNQDKTTIIYNKHLSLTEIPLEAYNYVVNGKSAIEWIMERYKLTKDKNSGIINDPNDWSDDPRYIIDLVKRIVRVSLETVKIVNNLPPLKEQN